MFMKLNDVAVVPEEVHHHRHLDLEAGLVVVIKTRIRGTQNRIIMEKIIMVSIHYCSLNTF